MPLKAGSQQNPLGQISVKWNEVKIKWKGEMKWREKEEGGWGLRRPRGYCYPHNEPLEQRPTMTASQSGTNIVWERWVGKMMRMRKKWREGEKEGGFILSTMSGYLWECAQKTWYNNNTFQIEKTLLFSVSNIHCMQNCAILASFNLFRWHIFFNVEMWNNPGESC